MDTLHADKEPIYYDLQQLSFTPGMTDAEYALVDKVLSLGHPEDWPEGVDYTDHAYERQAHLYCAYITMRANQLNVEHHEYQQQHELPRAADRIEFQIGTAQLPAETAQQAEAIIRRYRSLVWRDRR